MVAEKFKIPPNPVKRKTSYAKKNNQRYTEIVKKRVAGKSMRAISREMTKSGKPVSFSGVKLILSRDDVKQMLEKQYLKLASSVECATDNIIKAATDFKKGQLIEDKKISWEANKLIAQAHGLLPTANQSVVHQTFINNQYNTIIPPVIAELAAKHFGGMVNMTSVKALDAPEEKEVFEIDADA